jgi:release factor glutamine methyltransferase
VARLLPSWCAAAEQLRLSSISYQSALARAVATLSESGIDSPRREARLLLAHVLGLAAPGIPSPDSAVPEPGFTAALVRRAAREPLAYLTGRRGFWNFDVEVSPDTLIPRPDSETLIDSAKAALPETAAVSRILDLGTGTGCLLLAALIEFPAAFGVGTDRVPAAAALAARNAAHLGLASRAAFLAADWAAPLSGKFDLILCNPPYIESGTIPTLMPEVARHEPHTALDGGPSGLDAYVRLLPELPSLLSPQGRAILELGQGQAPQVAALAHKAGFRHAETRADLSGIDRALVLRLS